MSAILQSVQSSFAESSIVGKEKSEIFQDLPLLDRNSRLTIIELKYSDKQIVNELVYRWCRVITRIPRKSIESSNSFKNAAYELAPALAAAAQTTTKATMTQQDSIEDCRKVLIVDMIGSINAVRLATVMKRDERRMRMIGVAKGCKINSTYVTLYSYLGRRANLSNSLKLIVIYHDEFFIMKTLNLLKDCLKSVKCQVLLVVPRLDRLEHDMLSLITNYQTFRCDFCVSRREIGPAPPEANSDTYQTYLNQLYFQRYPSNKLLPDKVHGELREDGLYLDLKKTPLKQKKSTPDCGDQSSVKKVRLDDGYK